MSLTKKVKALSQERDWLRLKFHSARQERDALRAQVENLKTQFSELHVARSLLSRLSSAGFTLGEDAVESILDMRAEVERLKEHEPRFEDVERMVKTLSFLGVSTPESMETACIRWLSLVRTLIRTAEDSKMLRADMDYLAKQAEREPDDLRVYRVTLRNGETCHFGTESLARAWARGDGKIEPVDLQPVTELHTVDVEAREQLAVRTPRELLESLWILSTKARAYWDAHERSGADVDGAAHELEKAMGKAEWQCACFNIQGGIEANLLPGAV